jgi:hypothetical protein
MITTWARAWTPCRSGIFYGMGECKKLSEWWKKCFFFDSELFHPWSCNFQAGSQKKIVFCNSVVLWFDHGIEPTWEEQELIHRHGNELSRPVKMSLTVINMIDESESMDACTAGSR